MKSMMIVVSSLLMSASALAYVNPGAGITFFGAMLGFLLALLFVVLGILIWPVRRYLQYRREQQAASQTKAEPEASGDPSP